MKKKSDFIPLNTRINSFHKKSFSFIDKLGFGDILLIWIGFVLVNGFIYFFATTDSAYLLSMITKEHLVSLTGSIYFSFVSATTTGFGDIIPLGFFRVLASLEVVLSLLVVAVVTSKLISLKQDVILEELYEITFSEKINRMRSSLLVFRQNTHSLIHKVDDGKVKKRDFQQISVLVFSLNETIDEMTNMITRQGSNYIKKINSVEASILTNSLMQSFQRLNELFYVLKKYKLDWQSEKCFLYVERAIQSEEDFFSQLKRANILSKVKINDFEQERDSIINKLRNEMKRNENLKQASLFSI